MNKFYIRNGENEKGPLSIEQLKLELLKNNTPVWFEGLENWTTIEQVKELRSLIINTNIPPPFKNNNSSKGSTNSFSNYPPESEVSYEAAPKKNFKLLLIFTCIILFIIIIISLVYQNQRQANTINEVKQKILQQDQAQEIKNNQEEQNLQAKQIQDQEHTAAIDKVHAAIDEKYLGYRNNWQNFIKGISNVYTVSDLGGISNLDVIVFNRTDKNIDEVQVKVEYIKANGGTYKFETVSITNIGPGAKKSVSAPSSDRGTSVKINIESITAKAFHFCYPYGMDGNKNSDPYFCK